MKNKNIAFGLAMLIISCILFSSCIGSFGLTKKLLKWNKEIDSKFVNELVFVAFHIVPVYPVSYVADLLVINSIEFWKGENPVSDTASVIQQETENGIYTVQTTPNGYTITKEGEELSLFLIFEPEDNSWDIEYEGFRQKLFRHMEDDRVVMYLPGDMQIEVPLTQEGVTTFRQEITTNSYYALQ